MGMMVITYVTVADIHSKGGAIDHILEVSKGLAKLGNIVNLILCSSYDDRYDLNFDNLKCQVVPVKGLSTVKKIMKVARYARRFIQENTSDIIYLRPFPLDYLLFTRHMIRRKIPYVVELNTLLATEYKSKGKSASGHIYSFLEGQTIKKSAGILPVTDEINRWARKISGANKPFCIAGNGIDMEKAVPRRSREEIRRTLGVPDTLPVLVMAGFSRPWHGYDIAIRLLSKMKKKACLWLIGAESDEILKNAESLARQAGVADLVKVFPWIKQPDLFDIVAAADVGLAPLALERKGMTEAQSLKNRFYLALGLPILINHVDSKLNKSLPFIKYVFSSDPAALAAGVDELLMPSNDNRRDIRQFTEDNLSWNVVAQQTEDFLKQLIKSN